MTLNNETCHFAPLFAYSNRTLSTQADENIKQSNPLTSLKKNTGVLALIDTPFLLNNEPVIKMQKILLSPLKTEHQLYKHFIMFLSGLANYAMIIHSIPATKRFNAVEI